ncbi:hypothetical protein MH117_23480 [Paenibacillus sp. ACRRX]|uniref:hypothetical protein n=1 Tax=Paenibacillus sp. ACRRX TaxID=2918206 RepID=UPI001EF4FD3F|nr:hypothetical protein [Paenibacillus sp. ACRRX]MCG7410378.1 hypothetical protein [Paenibacillus sp. ACRRX]
MVHIRVNGKEMRELRDSQLSDVVQLLGEHMFAFKLDQAHNILDITHPIQGHQVVLESSRSELTALLSHVEKLLQETGFTVLLVNRDEDRRTTVKKLSDSHPISWIAFQYEPQQEDWSASFSFEQMKWSKPLAQLIMDNLADTHEISVRGVQLNWKNMMSSILAMSNKPMPTVMVNCGNMESLSVFQVGQLAQSIVKAITALYTEKPIMEITRAIRAMAYVPEVLLESVLHDTTPAVEAAEDGDKNIVAVDNKVMSDMTMKDDEDYIVGKAVEEEFQSSTPVPVMIAAASSAKTQTEQQNAADIEERVSGDHGEDKTTEAAKKSNTPVSSDAKSEINEAIFIPGLPRAAANYPKAPMTTGRVESIQKEDAVMLTEEKQTQSVTVTRQRAQSNSIFSMLKAHSDAVGSTPTMGEPEAKFMSYVNQMTLAQKKEQRVVNQNRFNILTSKQNEDK